MSKWLSAMMIDDFINDPVLATEVIFGFELPPHQQARLWGAWNHQFFHDSSGFGTGKTFTIALVVALRSMLFEDRVTGIIGKTYPQGKLVFEYFDKWARENKIFRNSIRKNRSGDPMLVHGADATTARFNNDNQIRVIPPDFLRDAERVASESWTDGYFDEWTRYRNYTAFNKVLIGRVRKPVAMCYPEDDPKFCNHFWFSGTAGYKWQAPYARISAAMEKIAQGDNRFDVQSWNFEHIPKRFSRLASNPAREQMLMTMRADEIQTEIYGRWIDDSVGYYNARAVADIRILPDCELVMP